MNLLIKAREIIAALFDAANEDSPADENYLEALNDMLYACDCSEEVFKQHLNVWMDKIVLSEDDNAYRDAIVDVAEMLTILLDEERMSYD